MSRETCTTCRHHVIGMPIDDLEPDHPCQPCVGYDNWSPAQAVGTEKTLADHIAQTTGVSPARLRQVGGDHYKTMGVEPWDVIDTWPYEQRVGAYRAGALKYIMRLGAKDAREQEVAKGAHYLEKLLEVLRAGR